MFAHDGKEYVAITVGGTPTSSNGGTASQLQVFSLPRGSECQRRPHHTASPRPWRPARRRCARRPAGRHLAESSAAGAAHIVIAGGVADAQALAGDSSTSNERRDGTGAARRRPVEGAAVAVDRYGCRRRPARGAGFSYRSTRLSHAGTRSGDRRLAREVAGKALTAAERAALRAASGGISVGYRIADAAREHAPNGNVLVTGRAVRADGVPGAGRRAAELPPRGHDHRRGRRSGRRRDRRHAHDRIATSGRSRSRRTRRATTSRSSPRRTRRGSIRCRSASRSPRAASRSPPGRRRRVSSDCSSATMNVKLPAAGTVFREPDDERGARRVLPRPARRRHRRTRRRPVRWRRTGPTATAASRCCSRSSVRGTVLHFWESDFVTFSRTPAAPGSAVDLSAWPSALPVHVPRDVGLLLVKR